MAKMEMFVLIVCIISAVYSLQPLPNDVHNQNLPDSTVNKVHVIFMNHLDVGYAGFINHVVNTYFTNYFPQAVKLGKQLADGGYLEKFTYMTHPWLVSLYLDCPPNMVLAGIKLKCPSQKEITDFKAAVKAGVITWHAGPMNMQIENMDEPLLKMAVQLSFSLDKKLNITREMAVLSQRDVPGITQTAIPILSKLGVKAVTVGVNSGSSPPAVPKVFRWKYGDAEIYGTWHPGGYPNNPGTPKHPGGLSYNDCATVPGFNEAMCYSFRTDNSGPPTSVQEVLNTYEILRVQFPGADIQASSFDQFFAALSKSTSAKLPVLTQEIGDTWIQGISSDPRKLADMRAVARVLGSCMDQGKCSLADPRVWNASRFLMKMPEHTWGLPSAGDYIHWDNVNFEATRTRSNFKKCELAWTEQKQFVPLTIEALEDHPIVKEIKVELDAAQPRRPNLKGFSPVPLATQFNCSSTTSFRLDGSGAISSFTLGGVTIATKTHPFGRFIYQTFDQSDIDEFVRYYPLGNWNPGYGKNNMTKNSHPAHAVWPTVMNQMFQSDENPCDVYIHVNLVDKKPTVYYGAPQDVWIRYTYNSKGASGKEEVDVDFQWFDKVTTRMPEALYFGVEPLTNSNTEWTLMKLHRPVDPLNVLVNGSQYVHAVTREGITFMNKNVDQGFQVTTLDAAVVSLMTSKRPEPRVYPVPLTPIEDVVGMAFNLYNNVWNTNYIYWYPYDENVDFRARFTVIPIKPKVHQWWQGIRF